MFILHLFVFIMKYNQQNQRTINSFKCNLKITMECESSNAGICLQNVFGFLNNREFLSWWIKVFTDWN